MESDDVKMLATYTMSSANAVTQVANRDESSSSRGSDFESTYEFLRSSSASYRQTVKNEELKRMEEAINSLTKTMDNEDLRLMRETVEALAKHKGQFEKTKLERDEARLSFIEIQRLYNDELRRRKECEETLTKEKEELRKAKQDREETHMTALNARISYDEELQRRINVEESLAKLIEELKQERDKTQVASIEIQRMYTVELRLRKEAEELLAKEKKESHNAVQATEELLRNPAEDPSLSASRPQGTPSYFIGPISQEILMDPHVAADGYTYYLAEPLQNWLIQGQGSGSRVDGHGSNILEDARWNRSPGSFGSGRVPRMDICYGGNLCLRPVQLVNSDVLRHPRSQSLTRYAEGFPSEPVHYAGSQVEIARNTPDADRGQQGLMPCPQTPLLIMHKAKKKYEVGKVTDEEQAKQRRFKCILNKLTPQNFKILLEQFIEVNMDNVATLFGATSQIFDKALMEPIYCAMYASFCHHLTRELPTFNENITFRRVLLNNCQCLFEEGAVIKQRDEEREENRLKVRRQMLGNIRLIGELYQVGMLPERVLLYCVKTLCENPNDENIEGLCILMSTAGEVIEHHYIAIDDHTNPYFQTMTKLSKDAKLSFRVRFMLMDAIDLRENKWQQREKVEGPKVIEELHRHGLTTEKALIRKPPKSKKRCAKRTEH